MQVAGRATQAAQSHPANPGHNRVSTASPPFDWQASDECAEALCDEIVKQQVPEGLASTTAIPPQENERICSSTNGR